MPTDSVTISKQKIHEILPHGPGFVFVDEVKIIDEINAIGYRKVKKDEPWVKDHFPGRPMFPGFYCLEAISQTAGIFLGYRENELDKQTNINSFQGIVGVENFSWRNPIVPGDDLIMKVRLMVGSHRHPLWIINGSIFVGETACCYGTIKAAYKKN